MNHHARRAISDRRGALRRANMRLSPVMLVVMPSVLVMGLIFMTFTMHSLVPENNNNKSRAPKMSIEPQLQHSIKNNHEKAHESNNHVNRTAIAQFKRDFYARYGGQKMAESMLQRGIQDYGSIQVTAERMLRAAAHQRPFRMAFTGYSVTVGRGNYFDESFPLVVQSILKEPMKQSLGIDLMVQNAGIGGIPSFPYGWCLEHFIGNDADVISWNYGLNEKGGAAVMEAYLRRGLHTFYKQPMFILLGSNPHRSSLLRTYVDELGLVQDALQIHRGGIVDQSVLEMPQAERPLGFQDWDEFGAPKDCPGRFPWHPKKKQHELMGWMIGMHFIHAMDLALGIMSREPNWKSQYTSGVVKQNKIVFPPPIATLPVNDESILRLLYGHVQQDDKQKLVLRDTSCRTSFLPASNPNGVLPSIVVEGMADMQQMEDIMQERSDELYHSGWVLDISPAERHAKKKEQECGGLGYIDLKMALYGIPPSGPLRLWLPHEGSDTTPNTNNSHDWFGDFLIVCEANEERNEKACQLGRDVSYVVGGIKATLVTSINGAGVYLERKTCFRIGIPPHAKVTMLQHVKHMNTSGLSPQVKSRLLHGTSAGEQQERNENNVGLVVDITIHNENVTRANGPCTISHVVWEQNER